VIADSDDRSLSSGLTAVMAAATGLIVANIYYNQPLLHLMARDLGARPAAIGAVPVLTQIGYAIAMLVLVPLGDLLERRAYICWMSVAAALSLALSALSGDVALLAASGLLVGFSSVVPQLIIPFAARLAPPRQRGTIIGKLMGGLLIGILGARVLAGGVGAAFGWRAMYFGAAGAMVILAVVLRRTLPLARPDATMSVGDLFGSILALVRKHAVLREATVTGACLFAAFSALWATLSFFLAAQYHYGSDVAGAFGLAGLAGAAAAPLAGRFADAGDPRRNVRLGVVCTLASFAMMDLVGGSIWVLAIGVALMDLGVQFAMVSNQSRIYALEPSAPSRVNTVYMTGYFCGGALGSGLGTAAWARWQWHGVCGVAAGMLLLALVLLLRRSPTEP
jgi:predicted MFS family arabinose efflux permease